MFEKVNPCHPDKIADRIAGGIVDLAYQKQSNPKIAVEVLIGHDECNVIIESSVEDFTNSEIEKIVHRITGCNNIDVNVKFATQDVHLAENQEKSIRCGDNGIFKGMPLSSEEKALSTIAKKIYKCFPTDGKYIYSDVDNKIIICQSNAKENDIIDSIKEFGISSAIINPLGEWTGGINVDSGATNRKLGSDMGESVTGGGLHGKDLSKADVSVNIYAHLKAQETGKPVEIYCAIGDETIDGKPYSDIVDIATNYIKQKGGFEKFAEWGLV